MADAQRDSLRRAWVDFIERALDVGGYSLDRLRGRPGGRVDTEIEPVSSWPIDRLYRVYYVLLLLYYVRGVTGVWPDINSSYRAPHVNEDRGGAPRSRHMYGEGQGKDFAAVDLQFPTIEHVRPIARMLRNGTFSDSFRAWAGLNHGVGVIIYDETVHLDLREHDWHEIKDKARAAGV